MIDQKLQNFIEEFNKRAKAKGTSGHDIILNKNKSLNIKSLNQKVDEYKVSDSMSVGVRVIKDNKVGISYSEEIDMENIDLILNMSLENAQNVTQNEHEKIQSIIDSKNKDQYIQASEGKIESDNLSKKIEISINLEKDIFAKSNLVKACPYNGFSEIESSEYFINSNDLFTYNYNYYTSCYTSALLNEGPKNASHHHFSMARNVDGLNTTECVEESFKYASHWLNASEIKTGKYDTIFTPDAFADLFNCFTMMFSGTYAKDGTNPFFKRIGEKCFNKDLTIYDDPFYQDAFFKNYFDSEGNLCEKIDLIENGILKNIYHNSMTASFFNTKNTKRASRSTKSSLGVGGSNIVFGKGSEQSITNGEYLEIHDMAGMHSGTNALTGDFSLGVTGFLKKDGQIIQAVKDITLGGNFYKMLNEISAIGDTIFANSSKNFFTPNLRFEKLTVAGS